MCLKSSLQQSRSRQSLTQEIIDTAWQSLHDKPRARKTQAQSRLPTRISFVSAIATVRAFATVRPIAIVSAISIAKAREWSG